MITSLIAVTIFLAPIRVACVGDSITWGFGADNPQSYPSRLGVKLGKEYEVKNFGHSGATLASNASLPYVLQPEYRASIDFAPNIVVILLGTNDAVVANWNKVKDEFVPQYKEFVASYRRQSSRPRVFICLPPPSFAERAFNTETGVMPLVKQVARESSSDLIDLNSCYDGKGDLFPDKLHPNAEGLELMASVVYKAISSSGRK